MLTSSDSFPRRGRCLLFSSYSLTPRDCGACRTIALCPYYDAAGVGEIIRLDIARWDKECQRRAALSLRVKHW